jgi:magnesium transporter
MIVNLTAYEGGRPVKDVTLGTIPEHLKRPDSFVWLGLFEPTEELMRQVQKSFQLHDLAIEDAHSAHQRPKVESYGDSLFVVLQTAQKIDGTIALGETHVFIGTGYIVTVRHGASLSYTSVRQRCETVPEHLARGPGFALYAVMDFVVDNYMPIVEELEDEISEMEEQILRGQYTNEITENLYEKKRDLMRMRRAAMPLLDVCGILTRATTPLITAESEPYFRDVHDHVLRINQSIEIAREMVTTALQVNLHQVTVKQNEVVKKLAGWAGLLGVPTMIASFYGMNFEHMPELKWDYGYPAVLVVCVAACTYLYYRLKKADWL